jgi:hypothetical protein
MTLDYANAEAKQGAADTLPAVFFFDFNAMSRGVHESGMRIDSSVVDNGVEALFFILQGEEPHGILAILAVEDDVEEDLDAVQDDGEFLLVIGLKKDRVLCPQCFDQFINRCHCRYFSFFIRVKIPYGI